jgi:hypothetical protein
MICRLFTQKETVMTLPSSAICIDCNLLISAKIAHFGSAQIAELSMLLIEGTLLSIKQKLFLLINSYLATK